MNTKHRNFDVDEGEHDCAVQSRELRFAHAFGKTFCY